MKATSLRNRKLMVDLNLKLAVVATTKRRDTLLSYKTSNFLELKGLADSVIDEDSKDWDTRSIESFINA